MLSDAHAHLYRYSPEDLNGTVRRSEKSKVKIALIAGVDLETSIKTVDIAANYDLVYACVGVHPWYADTFNDIVYEKLRNLAKENRVVAISETGLDFVRRRDYVYSTSFVKGHLPKEIQRKAFISQIKLAKETKLPLIIHENSSHIEILEILRQEDASKIGGAIHGFVGDLKTAEQYLELGFYISIGKRAIWSVLFDPDRTSSLRRVIEEAPIEKLLSLIHI